MKPRSYCLFQSFPIVIPGIASLLGASAAMAQNTQKNVAASATNLSLAAAYDPAGASTTTSDVTFLKYALPLGEPPVPVVYTNAGSLVITANVPMGTLNNLNADPLVIGNTSGSNRSITLNGGANTVSVVDGGSAADLVYLASNTNLSIVKTGSEMDVTLATTRQFQRLHRCGPDNQLPAPWSVQSHQDRWWNPDGRWCDKRSWRSRQHLHHCRRHCEGGWIPGFWRCG